MLRLFVERLMNISEQDAAAYRTVLYPNHYSEAPHRIGMLCSDGRSVTRLDTPNQGYDCSCDVFAVANVFCSLTGFNLSESRLHGDLFRLALVNHLLYRGQVYSRAHGAGRVETDTM